MTDDEDYTTAVVDVLPDCDVHLQMFGVHTPAAYDAPIALPQRPWAYQCEDCFRRFGLGKLGLGVGQRLVLAVAS